MDGRAGVTVPVTARVPVMVTAKVTGTDPAVTASIRDGPITLTTRGGRTAAIRAIQVSRQVGRLESHRSVSVAVAVAVGALAHSPFGTQPFPICSCLLSYPPKYFLQFQAFRSSQRSKPSPDLPLRRSHFRLLP
jgi:hypothetical protein